MIQKKIISAILSAVMAVTACTLPINSVHNMPVNEITVSAASTQTSGTCGYYVNWELDSKGVLTISGTGNMHTYSNNGYNNSPFYDRKDIKSVVIKDGVTSIGDYAFRNCELLASITIPDSVTRIGEAAFADCDSLIEIKIPGSVTSIGDCAFLRCPSLNSITILNPECRIYDRNLTICSGYDSNNKPYFNGTIYGYKDSTAQSYAKLYGYSFEAIEETPSADTNESGKCGDNLTWELDSKGVLTISGKGDMYDYEYNLDTSSGETCDSPFYKREDIKSVVIKDGVTGIGKYAFYFCTGIEVITFPDSVIYFRKNAFLGTKWLTAMRNKNPFVIVNSVLIDGTQCKGEVTIPSETASIATSAFSFCSGITSVTIPESVKSIGSYAFTMCEKLKSVTVLNPECEIYDSKYTISNDNGDWYYSGSICGYKNSTAQAYAEKYGYKFEVIDSETPTTQPTTTPATTTTTTTTTTTITTTATSTTTTTTTKLSTTTTTRPATTASTVKTTAPLPVTTNAQPFEWGRDNWNFLNTRDYFTNGKYRMKPDYYYILSTNVSHTEWENIQSCLENNWNGSCHGMSALAFLANKGLLRFSDYTDGANCLNDISSPSVNEEIESLINYYQFLQLKDCIQQQYRTIPLRSNEENINDIITRLKSSHEVLLGYMQKYFGGHAVIAYGISSGVWVKNGVTYDKRIEVLDPNFSMKYNENACIYFDSSSYSWCVPEYLNVNSSKKAAFNLITDDVDVVNNGGYIGSLHINFKGDYVGGLEIDDISESYGVTKAKKNPDGTFMNQAGENNDIIPASFCFSGGETPGKTGFILKDKKSSYMVSQDEPDAMKLKIDFENCLFKASAAACTEMVFDPEGYACITGSATNYDIRMVLNEGFCPTDWYRVNISGTNAKSVSLEKAEDGYIVNGNNLQNVTVSADSENAAAEREFSTSYKSAFIYEIDENTIGIRVDTDNNGTYETELDENAGQVRTKVPDGIMATSYGDTNLDGTINVADVVQLNKFLLNKKDNPIDGTSLANADCMKDGFIDSSDSTFLMNYISMQITADKLG